MIILRGTVWAIFKQDIEGGNICIWNDRSNEDEWAYGFELIIYWIIVEIKNNVKSFKVKVRELLVVKYATFERLTNEIVEVE